MWKVLKRFFEQCTKRSEYQPPRFEVDETGFLQVLSTGERIKYLWSDVYHVGIITTSDGPWCEDVYFIIKTDKGDICVPQIEAEMMQLFNQFDRLPGFKWEQAIEAMSCTSDATFPCWDRSWSSQDPAVVW